MIRFQMFSLKRPFLFFLLTLFALLAYSHEEPPKTVHEKNDYEKERLQIKNSGIAALSIWNYAIDSIGRKGSKNRIARSVYDKNGNVTEETAFSASGAKQRTIRYVWDQSNRMSEQITTDYKNGTERTVFIYDTLGLISKIIDYDSAGIITDWFIYQTNSGEGTITATKYAADSSVIYIINYTYEASSSLRTLLSIEQRDKNGNRILRIVNKNAEGLRRERSLYKADGSLDHTLKYRYTAGGEISEIIKSEPDGSENSRKILKYDRRKNQISQTEYNGNGILSRYLEFEYEYFTREE